MRALIGSTGFVGSHLASKVQFDLAVHRPDVERLRGQHLDLLVCAGLPAEKWRANKEPDVDWANVAALAQLLTSVTATRAVLISTIDVYQPALGVDETSCPQLDGEGAYGRNRAWFEVFFRDRFPGAAVVRLPALYAYDLRKNLVYDLVHGRADQYGNVNPASTFQFFDVSSTWQLAEVALERGWGLLNVATEPVSAGDVAALFGVELGGTGPIAHYDMRSLHAAELGGRGGYLHDADSVLRGIAALRPGSSVT